MAVCHHCGQDITRLNRASWNGLEVTARGDLFWRGIKQPIRLQRQQARILLTLMRRGEASHLSLDMHIAGDNIHGKAVAVHISHIRTLLRKVGVPVEIRNNFGFGYELRQAA